MITQYMESINNDYTITMMKVKAYMEASERQYEINRMESDLKVINENGTDDDLDFLYQEAENDFVKKAKAAVQKIIDAFVKFISDTKDKIISLFTSKEKQEQIDKVEKKVKLFPLLGRKKVIVEDPKQQRTVYKEHMSMLNKISAKIKGGQEVSKDEIAEVNKSFAEKHAKAIGVGAAMTVTLLAAIGLYKAHVKNSGSQVNEASKDTQPIMNDAKQFPAPVATAIAESASTISKAHVNDEIRLLSSTMKAISGTIKDNKNTQIDTKHVAGLLKEGYDDIDMFEADDDMGEDDPELNDSSDVKTEFDDPADAIDGFDTDDSEPDTDMWDNVMDDDAGLDEDDIADYENSDEQPDESGNNLNVGDAPEPENNNGDAKVESYSESHIEDLFNDIMASVMVESTSNEPSIAESLMDDIDNLFD